METAMGMNVKVSAPKRTQGDVRAMFAALGVTEVRNHGDSFDVFVLSDGGNIGYAFEPAEDVLTEAQFERSVWLEVRVDDVAGACAALDALAVPRVTNAKTDHDYFRAPGGMIFRVAGLA
ncbi:MAG: hypothetical protein AB8I08_16515 [Sandaracinaceae bacterium]